MEALTWPDERLSRRCIPVLPNEHIAEKVGQMIEVMLRQNGCGLAANQIGWNKRVFICSPLSRLDDLKVYINPVLCNGQGQKIDIEGCLSLPNKKFRVPRFEEIQLYALALNGEKINQIGTGHLARIWQHEVDHLNGLMINRFEEVAVPVSTDQVSKGLVKHQEQWEAATRQWRKAED